MRSWRDEEAARQGGETVRESALPLLERGVCAVETARARGNDASTNSATHGGRELYAQRM
jgi:hypothetical protein